MTEFMVNRHITLKLEGHSTNIYINGMEFMQCKRLVLNIPIKDIRLYDDIDSIDEASEYYDHYLLEHEIHEERDGRLIEKYYDHEYEISSEAEFWAHCSNLQTWYEHGYDTRILKADLAFPLLKRLTDVGDPLARNVFKEEIAKRIETGYAPVIIYLIKERYLNYLEDEELKSALSDPSGNILTFIFKSLTSSDNETRNAALTLSKYLNDQLQQKVVSFLLNHGEIIKKSRYLKSDEMRPIYRQIVIEEFRSKKFNTIKKGAALFWLKLYIDDFKSRDEEAKELIKSYVNEVFKIGRSEEFSSLITGSYLSVLTNEELRALISTSQNSFIKTCIDVIQSETSSNSKIHLMKNIIKILLKARDITILDLVDTQLQKKIESPNYFSDLELKMFEDVNLLHATFPEKSEDFLGSNAQELVSLLEEKIDTRFLTLELLQAKLELIGSEVIEPIFKVLCRTNHHADSWDRKDHYSSVLIDNIDIEPSIIKEKFFDYVKSHRLTLAKHEYFFKGFGHVNLSREDFWGIFEYGEYIVALEKALGFIAWPESHTNAEDGVNISVAIKKDRITRLRIIGLAEYADVGPIVTLPQCIKEIKSLEELDVESSGMFHIPEWIDQLPNLKVIKFGGNGLRSIPETIGNLKLLEVLNIEVSHINKLPKSIGNLKNLKDLNLGAAKLHQVPAEIGKLKALKRLDLQDNNLTEFPNSIGNLCNLEYLDLSRNQNCYDVPDMFENLKNLKVLKLGRLKFRELPESIKYLTTLKELDLSYCTNLTEIPDWVSELTNLEGLDLRGTSLAKIPASIKSLENLKSLKL